MLLCCRGTLSFQQRFVKPLQLIMQRNYSESPARTFETYLTNAANEDVTIVNDKNEVQGSAKRAEMRSKRLIHRATYAFVRNSQNLYYVQKRSALKDYCPNYFDPTPGGVVSYNLQTGMSETYEETNKREVEEEMGIPTSTPTEHLFTFYYEDERLRCFGDAWDLVYDGELKLQVEEVESVHMMSAEEIIRRADTGEKFTPDSMHAFREYVKYKGII